MSNDSILARIQRLEDIEAIGRLKTAYCQHCDASFNADAVAALFTDDGVWDGGMLRGRKIGRQAIREQFALTRHRIPFSAHLLSNAQIDVSGDIATGRWRMLMPFNTVEDGQRGARWQITSYEDDFSRVDGAWLFKCIRVRLSRLDSEGGLWTELDAHPQ